MENKEKEIEAMEGYSEQQISELKKQLHRSHEEQIRRVIKMVIPFIPTIYGFQ